MSTIEDSKNEAFAAEDPLAGKTTVISAKDLRLLVVGDSPMAAELATELEPLLEPTDVVLALTPSEAVARASLWANKTANHDTQQSIQAPVVCVVASEAEDSLVDERDLPGISNVDRAIATMTDSRLLASSRFLLVTQRRKHKDIFSSIDAGQLAAVISAPTESEVVAGYIRSETRRWFEENHGIFSLSSEDQQIFPKTIAALSLAEQQKSKTDQVDEDPLSLESSNPSLPSGEKPLSPPDPKDIANNGIVDFLHNLEDDSSKLLQQMCELIDAYLGPRPRLQLPAHTRLTRQDEPVDAVYLVLDGEVTLKRTWGQEVVTQTDASGPLIGLVSLTHPQGAYFTSVCLTQCEVIRLSLEQLETVLTNSPQVAANLTVLAIQSLTRRLVATEEIRNEKEALTVSLENERARLVATLEELEETRAELIASARFATLGELAAGLGHELNNPVAALSRAASHISHDLGLIFGTSSLLAAADQAFNAASTARPLSTREERALVRDISKHLRDDRETTRSLIEAGIRDAALAAQIYRDPSLLQQVIAGASLGSAVRNIEVSAARITELVTSLRAAARPDTSPVDGVDVNQLVSDTIRLTSHRMRDITVETDFDDVAPLRCYPGQIGQVLTNLLVNAAEALQDQTGSSLKDTPLSAPAVRVSTSMNHESRAVVIRVSDNGPGISSALLEKVFEPHFSTKSGHVRFGLGMGLGVSRALVEAHGGSLQVSSRPGYTLFTVFLPLDGPAAAGEGTENETEECSETEGHRGQTPAKLSAKEPAP